MPSDLACPDPETLRRFSLGQVTGSQADSLSQHIRQCSACTEALRVLQNGSLRPLTATGGSILSSGGRTAGFEQSEGGGISSLLPTGTDTADQLGIVRPSAPTIKMSSEGTFDF